VVVGDGFWEVFHRSRSPMLILDEDAVYTDANQALCRAVVRTRDQVVGQRLGFLSAPSRRADAHALWRQLLVERRLVVGWEVPQPDGTTLGIEIVATADLPEPGRHLTVCLPPSRPHLANGLSPRELEVTQLLARGLSGEQIAERLYLSPETVRTHIRNAMEGIGAHTRAQLVALALDGDLITLYEHPGLTAAP
jgi:DNA-binding CsgD family transcriptional regulator